MKPIWCSRFVEFVRTSKIIKHLCSISHLYKQKPIVVVNRCFLKLRNNACKSSRRKQENVLRDSATSKQPLAPFSVETKQSVITHLRLNRNPRIIIQVLAPFIIINKEKKVDWATKFILFGKRLKAIRRNCMLPGCLAPEVLMSSGVLKWSKSLKAISLIL